jgi:competence protein ComFC
VLLVDDVLTTGTTVNECAKALRKAGSSDVYVVTLARTL